VVEVDGRFDGRPGCAIARVPDLDYALVGGEDFGIEGLVAGGRGGVEEGQRFDGEAVPLVLFQEWCWGPQVVEVD